MAAELAKGVMARPVALITNFRKDAFPRILDQIAAGPRPPVADWYVGTYGISKAMAEKIAAKGFRYAPVCAIQPHTSRKIRKKRQLRKAEEALLRPEFAGEIPASTSAPIIPSAKRRAWGIEFGQRYRDYMRRQRDAGVQIDTWQFDEIVGKCASIVGYREFVGGILHGLSAGRPELGDGVERGFVWFSFEALSELRDPTFSAEVAGFWEEVARATLFLVGEEYPVFRGSAMDAARDKGKGHVRLDGSLRQLRRKYICVMTPGWKSSSSLGGNVDGKPPSFVTNWRKEFIDARIALQTPRGYGQFAFTHGNVSPKERIDDAVESLHFASEQLATSS
jgi:hypothetical protein